MLLLIAPWAELRSSRNLDRLLSEYDVVLNTSDEPRDETFEFITENLWQLHARRFAHLGNDEVPIGVTPHSTGHFLCHREVALCSSAGFSRFNPLNRILFHGLRG